MAYTSQFKGNYIDEFLNKDFALQVEVDNKNSQQDTSISNLNTSLGNYALKTDLNNYVLTSNFTHNNITGITPISKGGTGANNIVDAANNMRSYVFYKCTSDDNLTISSSNTLTKNFSITTHGRPVFMIVTGDWNPTSNAWIRIELLVDGVRKTHQLCHDQTDSQNRPFAKCHMLELSAGTHTVGFQIGIGSGSGSLAEENITQGPDFCAFEI